MTATDLRPALSSGVDLRHWLPRAVEVVAAWGERFGPFTEHPANRVDESAFAEAFEVFAARMTDNYPFFHPRYAGQMVKPPHPAAVVGYVTAMLHNPNNHAAEGGPATTAMEKEVVADLAAMFGLPRHVGHLTTSGTIANLEALYVARQAHPGKGIAYSGECHYTHQRMCHVLGVEGHRLPVDDLGRLDVEAARTALAGGEIGTIVLTTGTTGLGAVDPVHEVLPIAREHGVRVHVDAAYGGFYALLKNSGEIDGRPFRAIAGVDSVVVDPHKHGLQPYGCGAVLFADPGIGRHFAHDSPYTYFTDSDLHLGEISLECSRAGAAAAALWLTTRLLPLDRGGFGEILAACRRAATGWAARIEASTELRLYQRPELDIVTFFPEPTPADATTVDAAADRLLRDGMADDDPVYLSVLRVDGADLRARHPDIAARPGEPARIARSVLIKPEAEDHLDRLHDRVRALAAPAP
ncbi:aspartate aminotransferase family protein [Actinokineospora sp. PR83]|uniref:pyridoxal phosphate-dependent decarboxylase family protein n=1 Tax=Actinokineospora sp. PR83 TaxID=2884908 RepID=UPI0035ABD67B